MNTGKFLSIPAEEFHAASRSGRYMSSHLLADFRESFELYRRERKPCAGARTRRALPHP